jgi:dihydroxyacid dehydratase/phosphogluconate dehydratase
MQAGLLREDALTVNGRTIGEHCRGSRIEDERVNRPIDAPLVSHAGFIELSARRDALRRAGGPAFPASQAPWQEIQRRLTGQMDSGAILEGAERFQRVAQTAGLPRDNH